MPTCTCILVETAGKGDGDTSASVTPAQGELTLRCHAALCAWHGSELV